jgi:general secretion pathway protein F
MSSQWSIDAQGRLIGEPAAAIDGSASRPSVASKVISIDRVQLAEDLAELIAAGLSIRESLQILAERPGRAPEQRLLAHLRLQVEQGASLSQAMAQQVAAFGEPLVALVGASEMTSSLPEGLRRYAQVTRRVQALRSHIVSALVYPALLTMTGLGVLLFLLGVVVPRFAAVVQQNAQALSGPSGWLLGMGAWLGETRPVWMSAVLAMPVLLALFFRSARGRRRLQGLVLRLPRVGVALRDLHRARFFATTATLTLGGVPVLQALSLSSSLLLEAESARLAQGIAAIRRGDPIAQALSARPFEDTVILRLLEVAQRTASLPTTFERLAHLLETRVSRDIDRLMRLFEPVMMLALGLLIGTVVVLMYVPILELATAVQ